MPSVEPTVTTRPRVRSRYGSAARTTATVPSRFTATTRSHASLSTSPRSPQASTPAAVTTASRPPWPAATRRTAASASRGRARSTGSKARPSAGDLTSSTTGVPPSSATAAATAAPRPDEPPVTMTVPRPSADTGHLDQPGGGSAGDVRHDDGAPTPLGQGRGLRQLGDRVVPALDPDVRLQRPQDRPRVVLLEDGHGIHAAQGREHRHAVLLADQRP